MVSTLGNKKISKNDKIYFLGIAGTGMGSVAGLMQEAGYKVLGSDQAVYPPISTMLERLKIHVLSPYSAQNISQVQPDVVVVGNRHSKNQEEVVEAQNLNIPLTSFPELLEKSVLPEKTPLVISGTHGKTTTACLLQHCLRGLGTDPGFLIGGLPSGFQKSFSYGDSKLFVIEGDEYDSAFFDKKSKFLHYLPSYLIINNIEFDHADIFENLDKILDMFTELVEKVEDPSRIIVNGDCPGVSKLLDRLDLYDKVTIVAANGICRFADYRAANFEVSGDSWQFKYHSPILGTLKFSTKLVGKHNCSNIAMVLTLIEKLVENDEIDVEVYKSKIYKTLLSFQAPRRRMDILFHDHNTVVIEDFAHHPSAVSVNLASLKQQYPKHHVVACYEPANASSRRNLFNKRYVDAFRIADEALLGHCPVDQRIEEDSRMNTVELAKAIGSNSRAFNSNLELLDYLIASHSARRKPTLYCFMSPSSFSGIHKTFAKELGQSKSLNENLYPQTKIKELPNVHGSGVTNS